ncbi:MAG: hypothetical protein NXI04_24170 [Planctomycetaceae bacterium]|nr:hypothetical protein [Planctomycetaceae bacterium]
MSGRAEDLYGQWRATSGVLGGQELPGDVVAATKLSIAEGRYTVDLAGAIDRGACFIDGEARPLRIKISGEQGPNSGKTFLAIAEFPAAHELLIAYDLSGEDYPASFAARPNPFSYVARFRRCES